MSTYKLMNGDLGATGYMDRGLRVRRAAVQTAWAVGVLLVVSALVALALQNWQLKQQLSVYDERFASLEALIRTEDTEKSAADPEQMNQLLQRVASLEAVAEDKSFVVHSASRADLEGSESTEVVFRPEVLHPVADNTEPEEGDRRPVLSDPTNRRRGKRAANSLTLPFGGCTQGPPGTPGRDGPAGPSGRDGRDGIPGPAGPPGPPGPPSSSGPCSQPGTPGPPGPAGQPGTAGLPGSNGSDGRDGLPGPPGSCDCCSNAVSPPPMKDCDDVYKAGHNTSGVYAIQPISFKYPFRVYCEMEGGFGWTVIQKRFDGSLDFSRDWETYKNGFGDLSGEFWLGNDKIYQISNIKVFLLRIDLESFSSESAYAEYDMFYIEDEAAKYRLHVGNYSGTAGDGGFGLSWLDGRRFSTHDQDNDDFSSTNCAADPFQGGGGGWWYRYCDWVNLNQPYKHGGGGTTYLGIEWSPWHAHRNSIKSSVMKIRPALP